MKKQEKEELDKLFLSIIKLFRSKCYICGKKYNNKEAFVIHHLTYKSGEKIYSDFLKPDGTRDRLQYYRYLIPIVKKEPKRFMLLHHKHHWLAESMARSNPKMFERLVKVSRQINKRKYSIKPI